MKMTKAKALLKRGVHIPNPESVEVGEDISPERISGEDVVIHSGCRLFGAKTFIAAGARLGAEGPVTLRDCQQGPGRRKRIRPGFRNKLYECRIC